MEFSLFGFLSWYLVFLFSLVVHEAAHAFAAWKLGDPTAHRGGQVTLDPYPHIKREPVGTVVLPLLVYLHSGWMIGWASAPFDPVWASTYPRRHALMALAGPSANFCMVMASFLLMKIGMLCGGFTTPAYPDAEHLVVSAGADWLYVAARLLSISFYLNVILFLFNLIPTPPLDGWSVLKGILPDGMIGIHGRLGANPMLRWAGILVAWVLFPTIGRPVLRFAEQLLDMR